MRHALRTLRLNPGFTAVALLTLAIGIGANTAVFSVVNSVLLKPLAYPDPDRVVAVWHSAPGAAGLASVSGDLRLSASMFFTYAEQNRTFESLGVWTSATATVTGAAEPEQVRDVLVSQGALETLGVQPIVGRWLTSAEHAPGGPPAVLLGYGYWQRRFGGDRSVIGRTLTIDSPIDSRPREIVGVMPEGFRFVRADADLITPLAFDRSKLRLPGFGFEGVGRLKSGVTIDQARADIARLIPVWMDSWPPAPGINPHIYEKWRMSPAIRPLKQDVVGSVGNVLWILMATIGIVLVIASANVANLLLVRADGRQQELAIRAALGAGRSRIVQELLRESVLLGLLGGALGVGFAFAGLRLLVAIGPGNLPRLAEIGIDARALGFTLLISILSGLLFGAIPALKYAGPRIANVLQSATRTASASRERHRASNTLVVVQVALAVVLLIGAGLMIRTFQALRAVDPGFSAAEHLQTVRVSIPATQVREPARVLQMQKQIVDKIAAIPGVASVAFAAEVPMQGTPPDWDVILAEGQSISADKELPPLRLFNRVSPGMFGTLGTKLVAGRDFAWGDLDSRRQFIIVSENLAREMWGTATGAIGKRVATAVRGAPLFEVIGVVQDVRENGVQEPAPTIAYWPSFSAGIYGAGRDNVERDVTLVLRTPRAGTESLLTELHQAVWSVNASLPLAAIRTMSDLQEKSLARSAFTLVMLAIAGAMALVLGIVGIYGVISYAVSQRRREIGIRLALGAQQEQIRRMYVSGAVRLAAIGIAAGLAVSLALTPLAKSLIFGVSPLDLPTFSAVAVLLALAAALASYLPAYRASRVNPADTLR